MSDNTPKIVKNPFEGDEGPYYEVWSAETDAKKEAQAKKEAAEVTADKLYVDAETRQGNFKNYEQEKLVINGIQMPVLPSDISFYSTNAVTQDAYIRAPGAFTFKSKHSRSVLNMIVTVPVLELATINKYSQREKEMAIKGIDLITSLDAYPFCFIQSYRVKSYLGSHNFENEEGIGELGGKRADSNILMFGVQKITISQDARVPGVLVLEVDLLYNNHRTVTPQIEIGWDRDYIRPGVDFAETSTKLKSYKDTLVKAGKASKGDTKKTTEPVEVDGGMGFHGLTRALSAVPKARADILLNSTSSTMATDNFKSRDILSQIRIRIPHFINLHQLDIKLSEKANPNKQTYNKNDLTGNIENLPDVADSNMAFIRLPSKVASPNFYVNQKTGKGEGSYMNLTNEEADIEATTKTKANAYELYAVVWLEDKFAYTELLNPIQNIVVTKERAFASHFIGSYQHPFLQYMGRYPATLQITSAFRGSEYTSNVAPPYLFKMMLGALDANAVNYPQGNAFNYVKVEGYGNTLLGVEHFMPKDSQIIASSSNSDMEIFTCTFIENSMDKMLDAAKIKIGKKIIIPESLDASSALIQSYITNVTAYVKKGTLTREEEVYHNTVLDQMVYLTDILSGKVKDLGSGMYSPEAMKALSPTTEGSTDTQVNNNTATAASDSSSSPSATTTSTSTAPGVYTYKNIPENVAVGTKIQFSHGSKASTWYRTQEAVASDLVTFGSVQVHKDIVSSLKSLIADLRKTFDIPAKYPDVASGFRSVTRQKEIFKNTYGENGKGGGMHLVAPPGFSEHHTGYAVDIFSAGRTEWHRGKLHEMWTKRKDEYDLVLKRHGFTLSLDKEATRAGGRHEGAQDEAWHIVWLGNDAAKKATGR